MKYSIVGSNKTTTREEKAAAYIFIACAALSIIAVVSITAYMIISGTPAIFKVGLVDILFSTVWQPTAGKFGILYIILTSIIGTFFAVLLAVPIGLLTAVALSELVNEKFKKVMYALEKSIYAGNPHHQMTGGANLIAAILVLVIMILPTLVNVSETALETVPQHLRLSSLALGATKIQTIFKVVIPAAKNGIFSAIVLGVGRAIGEAMAILLVAGNAVKAPWPFNSVRFLTTAIVSEMGYSQASTSALYDWLSTLCIYYGYQYYLVTYIEERRRR
nr:ABC transporter permease subunit [Sharpea azabuensis]